MLNFGTSHFVSRSAAIGYYKPYEQGATINQLRELIDQKIAEGLTTIDNGCRYAIEETT